MTISIQPCAEGDGKQIALAGEDAFTDDELQKALLKDVYSDASGEKLKKFREWRVERAEARLKGEGKYYYKAIDDQTGVLVGFIGMTSPEVDNKAQISPVPPPDGVMDAEVDAHVTKKLGDIHQKWVGDRKDVWYVISVAVRQAYQRQGIASRLLRRALGDVDKAGHSCFLEASTAGLKLYTQTGFEVLERTEIIDGLQLAVMMRPPKNAATA